MHKSQYSPHFYEIEHEPFVVRMQVAYTNRQMNQWVKTIRFHKLRGNGFTVIELLIVIVVIGILAAIMIVSYNGVQQRAQNVGRLSDLDNIASELALYAKDNNGLYPATTNNDTANWKTVDVRTDSGCFNGSSQTDWIPGIGSLPQSTPNTGASAGVNGNSGCYLYASNGKEYVLSAWNMLSSPSTTAPYYRRLGFRSFQTATSTQFYTCNDNVTGGANGNQYDITQDYYKHSYTLSNITSCDETPPSGA
ncbi:MAG: PilE-like protein [Candidatus Saccharibacteria bacterium]|nr:PilE-like protein [Candidatus Saccharibacteria bacterium]